MLTEKEQISAHICQAFLDLSVSLKKEAKEKHKCGSCGDMCERDDMRGDSKDGCICFGCLVGHNQRGTT